MCIDPLKYVWVEGLRGEEMKEFTYLF